MRRDVFCDLNILNLLEATMFQNNTKIINSSKLKNLKNHALFVYITGQISSSEKLINIYTLITHTKLYLFLSFCDSGLDSLARKNTPYHDFFIIFF